VPGSVNYLSISLDTKPAAWKAALQKYNVPGINLVDTKNILRLYYKFLYVPHYVIIDAIGNVVNDDAPTADSSDLKAQLKKLTL
jgi:hypothetical protein